MSLREPHLAAERRKIRAEAPVSTAWTARTLRTIGGMTAFVAAISIAGSFLIGLAFADWNTPTDLLAIAFGMFFFLLADWLSVRPWKFLLLSSFTLLVIGYSIAALQTKDLTALFVTIVLAVLATGAVVPWDTAWQGALGGICLFDWLLISWLFLGQSDAASVDHWTSIIASVMVGVFSCYLRREFEKERAESQQRIRESEFRLRQILGACPDSITIVRERDLAVLDLLGQSVNPVRRETMLGKTISELDSYRNDPATQQFFRDLVDRGSIQNAEINFWRPDGEAVPHLASGSRVEIDGEPMLVCYTHNIADLKQVQRRLEESEGRFRSIFAAMPGSAAIIDANGKFLDLNRPLTNTGPKPEEAIGQSVEQIWANPAERREFLERFRRDGGVQSMEVHLRRRAGGTIPSLLSAAPLELDGKLCAVAIALDISELKETQRKLEESQARLEASEQRFRGVFEAMPGSAVIMDLDGKLVDINHPLPASGYTREEFLGRIVNARGNWLTPDKIKELTDRFRRDGRVDSFEILSRNKDGSATPALLWLSPMQINGVPHLLAITHDIGELKETQRRLEESQLRLKASEERFRGVFEAMPGMAAILDAEGRFVDLNRPFPGQGYLREEFIGRTAEEMGLFSDPGERGEFLSRLDRDGRVESFEMHGRNKDGSVTPVLISVSPMQVSAQPYWVGAVHDISVLKDAQRRAEESQVRFRKIFQANIDSALLTDFADGTILDANHEFVKLTGYSRDEILGSDVRTLNLWSNAEKRAEFANALRLTGEVRDIEDEIRTRDGRLVPCQLSGALLEVEGRTCCLAVTRDFTRIKHTQQQLVEAREVAFAASQAKSEFLSSMSHEIRSPLSAIVGMIDVLAETKLSQEQRRCLEVMTNNSDLLLRMINSVLDLARIESGRLHLELVEFDLIEVVESAISTFGASAHSKGLELTALIAPEVPEWVTGDPTRVRQVLINLLDNSIKFTESGYVALEIDLTGDPDNPYLTRFSVSDTGIGMAADKLSSIFSSFTQADSSTTRKYGGSGLGLAIVQRLATLMEGQVQVESEPGKGTKFVLTIPLRPVSKPSAPGKELPNLAGIRALVVDHHWANRSILRQMLSLLGAEVVEAESSEEALDAIIHARSIDRTFQLMLVDAHMPEVDGFELARRIATSANPLEAVIMMLSAKDLGQQLTALRESGCNSYLVKPITRSGLHEAILRMQQKTSAFAAPLTPETQSIDGPVSARILVAEDAADNRRVISAYLRNSRCEVEFAENGRVALEKFKARSYDLVLMDIQMPVMDGHAATRAIRSWERDQKLGRTPIIALTAGALANAGLKALAAGCDAHVTKPLRRAAMLELIRDHVTRSPLVSNAADERPGHHRPQAFTVPDS